jgi:hypothetical protein
VTQHQSDVHDLVDGDGQHDELVACVELAV